MTLGAGADAGDWVALLLLPLPPPPDCAITNATTATTTTSPSTAQRVPVFIEDLLQSISDRRRKVRRRREIRRRSAADRGPRGSAQEDRRKAGRPARATRGPARAWAAAATRPR